MSLLKEPKHIDFSTQSKPWTEGELADFQQLMQKLKAKNAIRKDKSLNQYSDKVLFPEKVEKARQAFEKLGLPDLKKKED